MKTLVRIQEGQDTKLGFGFMTIQVLVHPYKNSDTIDVIGHISFQRTLNDTKGHRWYAMKFNVETDKVEHLQKMTSLLRFIKKHPEFNWDSQPEDILKMIGAVEYVVFQHEFIPKSAAGKNLYDVCLLGSVSTRIIAADEEGAEKLMKKRGYNKHELKLNTKIIL